MRSGNLTRLNGYGWLRLRDLMLTGPVNNARKLIFNLAQPHVQRLMGAMKVRATFHGGDERVFVDDSRNVKPPLPFATPWIAGTVAVVG